MTKTSTLIASAAVIALTLGVTSRADVPTKKESILPPGVIIVAGDEAQPPADQPDGKNPTTGTTASDQNAAH